jgi:hypothetical protein
MFKIRNLINLGLLLLMFSCAVTNSLYVNDPVPEGANLYVGIGTGVRAGIESVDQDGNINFSDDIDMAPNVYAGGQLNLVDKLDLRLAIHLPYLIGGFGLRAGPQYSFFRKESIFNMAFGTDLGFVVAKDSLKIFGTTSALDIYANGAINADIFLPISIRFKQHTRIIITPRYSFNTIFIRYNTNDPETFKFKPNLPSLALGLRMKRLYFEISAFRFQDEYFPNFGMVYIFDNKE